MFVYLWILRQEREFLAHRAQIQAVIDPNNHKVVQSAFDDLTEAFNPYLEGHKKEEEKKAKERMLKEINRGVLGVTPVGPAIGSINKVATRKRLVEQFKESKDVKKEQHQRVESQFTRRRTR